MTTDDMKCDGVAKLKFSEVRKMFRDRQVEMDEPGVWLMAGCDGSTATYEADGLEGQLRSILYPMAAQALGELMAAAERQEPEAWGALATWFARGMDVLSGLLNGAAEVRVMTREEVAEMFAAEGEGGETGPSSPEVSSPSGFAEADALRNSEHQEGGEA